ncbi:MAG: hypothetical protein K1X86_02520 [Ignavibacteria bacterium]|nr:hypothetical protein [Ignavibacteria bacterium]
MKKLAVLFLLLISFFFQKNSFAQNDNKYTQEDYEKMIPNILKGIEWLETTPVTKDTTLRKEINAYVLVFAAGYHGITISIRGYLTEYSEANPQLLMAFIAGAVKYELATKDKENEVKINAAGLKSILNLYNLGGIKKNDAIDTLIEKEKTGKLDEFIREKLEKEKE